MEIKHTWTVKGRNFTDEHAAREYAAKLQRRIDAAAVLQRALGFQRDCGTYADRGRVLPGELLISRMEAYPDLFKEALEILTNEKSESPTAEPAPPGSPGMPGTPG